MPYEIQPVENGLFKVCKVNSSKCFSKKGIPKKRAIKQMKAIQISEHLKGGYNSYEQGLKNQQRMIDLEPTEEGKARRRAQFDAYNKQYERTDYLQRHVFGHLSLNDIMGVYNTREEQDAFMKFIEDGTKAEGEEKFFYHNQPPITDLKDVYSKGGSPAVSARFNFPTGGWDITYADGTIEHTLGIRNKEFFDPANRTVQDYINNMAVPLAKKNLENLQKQEQDRKDKMSGSEKFFEGLNDTLTNIADIGAEFLPINKLVTETYKAFRPQTSSERSEQWINENQARYEDMLMNAKTLGEENAELFMGRLKGLAQYDPNIQEDIKNLQSGTKLQKALSGGLSPIVSRVGGKNLLKKKIVNKYFPKDYENMTYIEPFVGGGSIFFYKNPSVKEIINDKDSNICKIFMGMKKYNGSTISKDINGNYNKDKYEKILNDKPKSEYGKFIRLLKLFRLSFFGHIEKPSYDGREYINSNFGNKYQDRLKDVTILNKDYLHLIKKYDSPTSFFYLDPPYEDSDGLYKHDLLDIKHIYDTVKNIKGKFMISYNDSKEARDLFKNYNIYTIKTKYTNPGKGGHDRPINELIITNYKVGKLNGGKKKVISQINMPDSLYLERARKIAKEYNYNPKLLHLSNDKKHKLVYDGVKFGSKTNNDFIIYTWLSEKGDISEEDALKHRDAYLARASKIKGNWVHNNFSPNWLAIRILWVG